MKKILSILTFFIATNAIAQNTKSIFQAPLPPPPMEKKVIEDSLVYQTVEIEAEFPGGLSAWIEFLQKNLNADVPANKKAKAGIYTVIVAFVVNRDGTLSNFKLETNPGYGTGEEVLRVMKKSPKWKPGYQNANHVSSVKRQPISFQVTN